MKDAKNQGDVVVAALAGHFVVYLPASISIVYPTVIVAM